MQPKTLKFRAVGMALVQDYEAMEGGVRRYVGRKATVIDDRLAWPAEGVAEVPYRNDYVAACVAGDLEAADAETAKACGLSLEQKLQAGLPDGHRLVATGAPDETSVHADEPTGSTSKKKGA